MPLTLTAPDYYRLARSVLAPPTASDMWDWCRHHLVLHDGKKWDPRKAAVFRHWYRVLSARITGRPDPRDPYAHRCEQLWLIVFAQAAKTTLGTATLAFTMANAPRKMAWFMNRLKDTNNYRVGRLQRVVMGTRPLHRLLPAGDEALAAALNAERWTVGGSMLYWRSGNVADDWRSEDFETIALDEFERYGDDVGSLGDPIESGLVRQRNYRKTKLCLGITTPGRPNGHGWRRLNTGSHERPLIDCPHCAAAQWLDWRNVRLADGREFKDVNAAEISKLHLGRYQCGRNGCLSTAAEISSAIDAFIARDRLWCPGTWAVDAHHPEGHWTPYADLDPHGRLIAIAPTESTIRSGHAGSLFSMEESIDTIAAKRATMEQGGIQLRKAFVNNEGAEPYIATVNPETTDQLVTVATSPDRYIHGAGPKPVRWIAIMLDQQGNDWDKAWFPYIVRGYNAGGESWLIEAGTAKDHDALNALLVRNWKAGDQPPRPADVAIMDSANGNVRFKIYLWAAAAPTRRMLVRGDPRLPDGTPWLEVVDTPNMRRRTPKPVGVREWRLHPTHWRNDLWNRMRRVGGATPWWLPAADLPNFYAASLTSEEQVIERRRITGVGWADVVVWRPRVVATTSDAQSYRTDNHWWDSEADLCAVADILGWSKTAPKIIIPRRRLV